ncbi:MAG: penicillin-binding protein 2, partial [Azospirillaceae bacterium]
MDRDTDRYRSLTRRALVLGGVQTALFGTLAARMYVLQVTEAERYHMLAEENRINMRLIAPSRGQIADRFGVPLAVNNQNFRVLLVAEQARDVEAVLETLSSIVPLDAETRERVIRDVSRRRAFVPVTVADTLTWEQVSRIEVNAPELPGLSIDVGESRAYPEGDAAAHVLGYVGAVSEKELTGDPVLALPDFRIGKTGIERIHDLALRGEAGTSQVEVNAVGRIIRELDRDEGTPGQDIQLTLDMELQAFVQNRLAGERSASAVVMDTVNGEIFALASHPSFDPNRFATGIDARSWQRLLDDPYHPLNNKAVTGQYAPGSTFKMLVALAGLESGAITPDHEAWCPGHMDLGNHRFHCWKRGGHGRLGLIQAVAQSCDVYFYDISKRIGIDAIAEMANRFGLGVETGIDMPSESAGLMPTRAWKQAVIGSPWQQGETLVAAIGQGYVLATPLQLAVMTARLVNGGKAVTPHLTLREGGPEAPLNLPEAPDLGIQPHWLSLVTDSMVEVTEGARGTARASQIETEGMEMGGKTGTSQVRRITKAERATGVLKNEERPWRERDHALFVGFAPIHAPRYACAVVVEHGGGGSSVAAPIVSDILRRTQERGPARPLVGAQASLVPAVMP